MRRPGGTSIALALVCAGALAGCSASQNADGGKPPPPSPVEMARTAVGAGNYAAAETVLTATLSPPAPKGAPPREPGTIIQSPDTPDLLVLRAEVRIRLNRFPEAESDALTAMALVPATAAAEEPAGSYGDNNDKRKPAPGEETEKKKPAPRRTPLTQRSIHIRLAQVYEDSGNDDGAEQHLLASRELCLADAELVEKRDCERERTALVRIRIARGHYAEAEPLVLTEVAEVQQRYGAYDLHLSVALCHAARFYARQGKYTLSGPLFARSLNLWKTSHEDAAAEHKKAIEAGLPSPFDAEFLKQRAGNSPFAAPCGLESQPSILYKLGKAGIAADAIRYERQLWIDDNEAGNAAVANAAELSRRESVDPLELASARNAVAFIAVRKGDTARAEQELRATTEAYAAAWQGLSISERRYRSEDYLGSLESLIEILRSSQRFPEAIALGEKAKEVAAQAVDPYDSLRLDTLLSEAITYREMRDPEKAEAAAAQYLDAVVNARGDRSADYAWALRTISFAYLLRDELDASGRMEMQAKAIWAKQAIVAPEF